MVVVIRIIFIFSGLDETHKLVTALGGRCHSYVVDLADRNEVYVVAKEVRKDCGPVSEKISAINGGKEIAIFFFVCAYFPEKTSFIILNGSRCLIFVYFIF